MDAMLAWSTFCGEGLLFPTLEELGDLLVSLILFLKTSSLTLNAQDVFTHILKSNVEKEKEKIAC